MTVRTANAIAQGMLVFIGGVCLGTLTMWDADPGAWPIVMRALVFGFSSIGAVMRGSWLMIYPGAWVLKKEKEAIK
jgi:hypothetical protein